MLAYGSTVRPSTLRPYAAHITDRPKNPFARPYSDFNGNCQLCVAQTIMPPIMAKRGSSGGGSGGTKGTAAPAGGPGEASAATTEKRKGTDQLAATAAAPASAPASPFYQPSGP